MLAVLGDFNLRRLLLDVHCSSPPFNPLTTLKGEFKRCAFTSQRLLSISFDLQAEACQTMACLHMIASRDSLHPHAEERRNIDKQLASGEYKTPPFLSVVLHHCSLHILSNRILKCPSFLYLLYELYLQMLTIIHLIRASQWLNSSQSAFVSTVLWIYHSMMVLTLMIF